MSYTPPVGVVDLTFNKPAPVTTELDFMWGIEIVALSGVMAAAVVASGAIRQKLIFTGTANMLVEADGTLVARNKLGRTVQADWQQPEQADAADEAAWGEAMRADAADDLPWDQGQRIGAAREGAWDSNIRLEDATDVPWGTNNQLSEATDQAWAKTSPAERGEDIRWGALSSHSRGFRHPHRYPAAHDFNRRAPWGFGSMRDRSDGFNWNRIYAMDRARPRIPWGAGMPPWLNRPPRGGTPGTPPAQPPDPRAYNPPTGTVNLCFWEEAKTNADLTFQRQLDPCKYRSTLTMIHSASLVRLPERTPIPFLEARLDFAAGDMAWGAQITLPTRAAVDLVAPTVSQQYEVELNIDGHLWWFLVEGYSEGRQFGETNYSIDCRSVSAWLGAPYALPAPQPTDAPYTARQLAEAAVTALGWTIDWQLLYPGDLTPMDWLVPAGAWRHDPMTPIEAVQAIAQACGAIVVPARAARTLTVRYAHPVPRWEWSTATPDRTLAPSRLVRIGAQFKPAAEYDKVYVFGEAGGVACGVKRTGYAGNKPAPTIIDPLNTHVDCGRERGRQALSAFGNRLDVSIDQPFADTDYGITPVWPGLICEVTETVPWRALSTAISIDLQRDGGESGPLVAAQTITLERAQ